MGMFRDMKESFQVIRSDELKELKKKADANPRPGTSISLATGSRCIAPCPPGRRSTWSASRAVRRQWRHSRASRI